jgi:hypothetical protein
MNIGLIITGFWLGTIKFLFAHWTVFGLGAHLNDPNLYVEIFISTTTGAWVSMAVFYFSSGFLMKRAAKKREEKRLLDLQKGIVAAPKKNFTRTNKFLVKIKRSVGIYGVTIVAPLFLSIPIGSIICAKFFGDEKKTFPLMLLFTALYSVLMCFLIWLAQ